MTKINHFDILAPLYDHLIKPGDTDRFCEIVGLPTSGRLLDVGGGTGRKSASLIDKVGAIIVADSSRGMLAQARNKGGLSSVRSEAERLPFEDESFERVIMVDAFHHVYNQHVTTSEMWRVLKPGGRIVIEEPDIRTTAVITMAVIEKMALMRSHFISPNAIAACFDYPQARIGIEIESSTAWIMVEKATR